jgi:hypothetical protein
MGNKCVLTILLAATVCAAQTQPAARHEKQKKQNNISDLETPTATFHGTLKSLTKKELVLTLPEDHEVAFYVSHKTKFLKNSKAIKPSEIPEGAPLAVDGKRDVMGDTEAVTVTVETLVKREQSSEPAPGGDAAPPR